MLSFERLIAPPSATLAPESVTQFTGINVVCAVDDATAERSPEVHCSSLHPTVTVPPPSTKMLLLPHLI